MTLEGILEVMMTLEAALGAMTLEAALEVMTSQDKLMPEMILVTPLGGKMTSG
jgi:orotidine-5'-phosphate decarboxylase